MQGIPFADKFYYQQMFKVTELPQAIYQQLLKKNDKSIMQYSENMIVYTGRKGIHIFDIDRERWVFNSRKAGYQYEDIYHEVREIDSDSEDAYDEEQYAAESDGAEDGEAGGSQGPDHGPPMLEELKEMMENEMQEMDEEFDTQLSKDDLLGLPPMLDRDNKSKSA